MEGMCRLAAGSLRLVFRESGTLLPAGPCPRVSPWVIPAGSAKPCREFRRSLTNVYLWAGFHDALELTVRAVSITDEAKPSSRKAAVVDPGPMANLGVDFVDTSQKARQIGLSWQARSVRGIYTAHHRVRSPNSSIGHP